MIAASLVLIILEAFRGGESGLIICELLRVYHQHFRVTQFIVKPYQFGLRNPEAIRTGAFWFYYKLGFRPENDVLKNLALKEAEFKQANPAYKTETATLRRFTKSNLVLSLSGASTLTPDPEKLSEHITRYIQLEFNGDRKTALNACLKRLLQNTKFDIRTWRKEDLEYARQVALLFCIYPNCDEWQKQHKKQIGSFILLKSAKTEMPWIKQLRTFKGFWKLIQTPLSF